MSISRSASGGRMAALALFILTTLFAGILPPRAAAQTTSGKILGLVVDPAGVPLNNVKVTLESQQNRSRYATRTNDKGYYEVDFLPPGLYDVTAEMPPDFHPGGIRGFYIPINRAQELRLPDITLQPAAVATPPPPKGDAGRENFELTPLVSTGEAQRGGNFSDREMFALPLGATTDMRPFDEYALLVPGVAPPPYTPGVRGPGVGFGIGTAGQFAVNGARARANNFTVDGSDLNDPDVGIRRQGFLALVPQPLESVRAFSITTLLWSAQLGRNLGSQVNAVSKEGGSAYRGTLYGFVTDSRLNARNTFDFTGGASDGEDPFTRVQAGLAVGGPLGGARTQFFGSFERLVVNAAAEQHFATPSAAERRFQGAPELAILRPGPNFNPNDFFFTDRGASQLGLNVLSLYPLPNNPGGPYGANTYTEILPADGDGNLFSFKVTHQFNDANKLAARHNFTDDERVLPAINRAIRSTIDSDTRTQNLSLIYDMQFGAQTFNQARFSYGRTRLNFFERPDSPFTFSRNEPSRFDDGTGWSRAPARSANC